MTFNLAAFDLNLLVAFDAIFTEGQVSRAADKIGVTQPAMSRILKRLREATGDQLFVKGAHGMIPTPRAHELHGETHPGLSRIASALSGRQPRDPGRSTRRFAIGTNDMASSSALPPTDAIADDQHADHQPRIDRKPTCLAAEGPKALTDVAMDFERSENGGAVPGREASDYSSKRMVRVRSVLAFKSSPKINADQKHHLEQMSLMLDKFGTGRRSSLIASALRHVGNYWRSGILLILRSGQYRPGTIVRLLHAMNPDDQISRRILNVNLKELERDGYINRHIIDNIWNHVEYSLTETGYGLAHQVQSLVECIADHGDAVAQARARYDASKEQD